MRPSDHHALRLIRDGRIHVDPATGVVVVDGVPRGSRAGAYNRIHCDGMGMMAHRIVWLWVHGHIPDAHVINHRDGNGRNNRIGNLEAVTQQQNVLHAMRHARYRGIYPGDSVDQGVAAAAAALAARGHATREEILDLIGVSLEVERPEDDDIGGHARMDAGMNYPAKKFA